MVFAAGMAGLYLLLNGSIWLLSHWMLQEKKPWKLRIREGVQFFLKAWASIFILLVPFKIASYYVLLHFIRASQSFDNIAIVLKILLVALFAVSYFLLTALAVAQIQPWKKFAKTWIQISITRFRKTIVIFFLIIVALFASFAALYGAIEYEKSAALLLLLGLFCIIAISVTRIFWIASIREIQQETEK